MINYDLNSIRALIFDVDGVLSKPVMNLSPSGDPVRTVNVKDGYAIQLASKLGYHLAVISGAVVTNITKRLNMLGVEDVFTGVPDKVVKLDEYMEQYHLTPDQIVYMGDDIPDLRVMHLVGVPACPADAADEVKQISVFISDRPGGRGCVRDVIEHTLKVQGKWMTAEAYSW